MVVVLAFSSQASGQMYQYTDKDGNVVFSDRPPVGPGAKEMQLKNNVYYSAPRREADPTRQGSNPLLPGQSGQERKPDRDYGNVTVILYKTAWCGPCKRAGAYIRSLGANLVEHDIEKDESKRAEMKRKSGGFSGVPLIDIEGTILRGFSEAAVKAELDRCAAR
jgi:glutaredoxin